MSGIDKDPKSKLSKPSDKKFFLGFKDGYPSTQLPMFIAVFGKMIRRNK